MPPGKPREWSKVQMLMGMEHLPDTAAGRGRLRQEAVRRGNEWLEERGRHQELGLPMPRESSAWFRGGEEFRDWLLERFEKKPSQADRVAAWRRDIGFGENAWSDTKPPKTCLTYACQLN